MKRNKLFSILIVTFALLFLGACSNTEDPLEDDPVNSTPPTDELENNDSTTEDLDTESDEF